MEPNRRLEYAYQERYNDCGHTIHRFGRRNGRTDAQFEAGDQPLVYLNGNCEDCKVSQIYRDGKVRLSVTGVRNLFDEYVKKLHEFSTENMQLKTSISKKDVEYRKALRAERRIP